MITRLHVRNFKSLRNVDIPLGPLDVLVGPNMGGKSNIVDVFKFVYDFVNPPAGSGFEGLIYALAQRNGFAEILWKGANEGVISLSLEGAPSKQEEKRFAYQLEIALGQGGFAYIQKESLRVRIGNNDRELIVDERGQRWLVNAEGHQISSSGGTQSSALQYARPDWEGHPALQSILSWRFFQLVPAIMKLPTPTASWGILNRHGENLSGWLMQLQTRFPEEFARINEVARDVFPGLRRLLTSPTPQGTVYLSSHEQGLKRPINVWQMSDGELAFIGLLSLIYAPLEHGGDLYCIEEPENHVHPRLLGTLVELTRQVRQEIMDAGRRLAQVIVTTQSPYLVDHMTLDEIVWVQREKGETQAFRPKDQKHLRKMVEDKELGLGDIVYSGLLSDKG
ncbi:AAA family ATPase [Acidobacteriia bacterium AH_259_A11_L15]|nr:AAA family ATPase [Acidobacteriia bacterium AH_259_A11_L15]